MREDKLQALLKMVDREGIDLIYTKFKPYLNIQGIYYKDEGLPPIIGINDSITNDGILYTCVLAEELGHHFTTIGDLTAEYYSYSDRLVISKKETLAAKWATEFLLSVEELEQAQTQGFNSTYEVAESLGVTEDFLLKRLEFLRRQQVEFNF